MMRPNCWIQTKKARLKGLLCAMLIFASFAIGLATLKAEPQQYPTPTLKRSIGVVNIPPHSTFYQSPSLESPRVDTLRWNPHGLNPNDVLLQSEQSSTPLKATDFFLNFIPAEGLAFLPVCDDTEEGWLQVELPHLPNEMAWLPPPTKGESPLFEWGDFIRFYTKKYGFHWLSGVSPQAKSVYLRPEETAPLAKVTFVQSIRMLHVRGNWMLVELRDLGEERPIGWLRWREDDGNFLLWPDFKSQKQVFQSPSNPMNIQKMLDNY